VRPDYHTTARGAIRAGEDTVSAYLLIESRDPLESADSGAYYGLAASLAGQGAPVTLFLVQNGVFPARPSVSTPALEAAVRAGVEVLADDFSLRERGIPRDRLPAGVGAAPIDIVVDRLLEGRKALWH
jgi:predicted peroxiredoxin